MCFHTSTLTKLLLPPSSGTLERHVAARARPLLALIPAVGDACYTGPMLAALEERYPGWDSSGEYRAALREREEAKRLLLPDEAAAAARL